MNIKTIGLLLLGFFASINASAGFVYATEANLNDFNFTRKDTKRCSDSWTTMVQVDQKKYYRSGCGGSQTSGTMRYAIEKVLRSPVTERCVLSRSCYRSNCYYEYGQQVVTYKIKMRVSGSTITHFYLLNSATRCR